MKQILSNNYKCFIGILLVILCACDKPCLPPHVTITGIETVFSGDQLTLTATAGAGASFSWTGPNNFTSTSATISIPNATVAASGEYKVKVTEGGCDNTTSKNVDVVPGPTCSPANNTINFGSTMTFSNVSCPINSVGRYEIRGTSTQGDFRMEFYTNPLLKPSAVYEFSTGNSNQNNVFMQIDLPGLSNWQAKNGSLYVKVVNGKMIATFCSVVFGNLQFGSTSNGSGKLSCP